MTNIKFDKFRGLQKSPQLSSVNLQSFEEEVYPDLDFSVKGNPLYIQSRYSADAPFDAALDLSLSRQRSSLSPGAYSDTHKYLGVDVHAVL